MFKTVGRILVIGQLLAGSTHQIGAHLFGANRYTGFQRLKVSEATGAYLLRNISKKLVALGPSIVT